MPQIFISYRRSDTQQIAGRIYDWLSREFGEKTVFMDTQSIARGADFRKVLDAKIKQSDVMLVLIGDSWLPELRRRNQEGKRDWVKYEVERGLAEEHVIVIPILIGKTSMIAEEDLPEALKNLAYRNSSNVRFEPDFRLDIQELVEALAKMLYIIPASKQAKIGARNQSHNVSGSSIGSVGDNFSGEITLGDKFEGDKVQGNKVVNIGGEHPKIPILRDKLNQIKDYLAQEQKRLKAVREEDFAEANARRYAQEGQASFPNLIGLVVPVVVGLTAFSVSNIVVGLGVGVVAFIAFRVWSTKQQKEAQDESEDSERAQAILRDIKLKQEQGREIQNKIKILQSEWAAQSKH